jgi:lipopolysaccharide export system permease protein
MIRILDRYVSSLFASAIAVFTVAFTGLFIAIDFASNLGKFLDLKHVSIPKFILWYYAIRVPYFLTMLLPMVVLFAAIFTVIKLQRTNEVLPIAASGISLRRMSAPFLLAAFLGMLAVASLEEFALPALASDLARTEEIRSTKEWSYGVGDYIPSALIWGRRYDHVHQEMIAGVRVTLLDADHRVRAVADAERATWDRQRRCWVLFNGSVEYEGDQDIVLSPTQRPRPRVEPIFPDRWWCPSGWPVPAPFRIESLRTSASSSDRYAFSPVRDILREARKRPDQFVWRMRFHSRLSFPVSPVVLMLVGLPTVAAAHSKSFVRGLTVCGFQVAIYFALYLVTTYLGNHGTLPPPLAAWFAPGTFGLVGLWSFSRMKT